MNKKIVAYSLFTIVMMFCLVSCTTVPNGYGNYYQGKNSEHLAIWQGNTETIWAQLQHTSSTKLLAIQNSTNNPEQKAWTELALISKKSSKSTIALSKSLMDWRARFPHHPANALFPNNSKLNQLINAAPPRQIAILLPQSGIYGPAAHTVREGFLNAYYANLPQVGKQNVKFYDTNQATDMEALYNQAIADGADFVVGPLVKNNVAQLKYGHSFKFPTIALNYTDNIYDRGQKNFYEFGLLPEDEAMQIADRARRAGRTNAIVIAPRNAWGKRLAMSFASQWQALGGSIKETWYFSQQSDYSSEIAKLLSVDPNSDAELMKEANNKDLLEQQRRHDFDVIFLFSQPKEARIIVPLLHYYHVNGIPIYATSAIYTGRPNPADTDLNNVIVCDIPWNMHPQEDRKQIKSDRLYAVGQDAYLLSQNLSRLAFLPNFPIYGTTGALTISPTQQIHRRLPCSMVRNGHL